MRVFLRWLNLNLEQQSADLEVYAACVGSDVASVIEQRLRLGLSLMVPHEAPEAERQLFLSDLHALFELERKGQEVGEFSQPTNAAVCSQNLITA